MDNSFKNPFQINEQDQIINLHESKPLQSIKSYPSLEPVMFNPTQTNLIDPVQKINNKTTTTNYDPMNPNLQQQQQKDYNLNQDGDPPLLQDIGINIQIIKQRMIAVLSLKQPDSNIISSPDLTGPIIITFTLGILLLLGQKFHFSDIQGNFIIGNIIMYFLFNYMSNVVIISYSVMCFIGYSLLPMLILAIFGIFTALNNTFGVILSLILSYWFSKTGGNAISYIINRYSDKYLVYYPLFLFYINFALIIIF